MSYPDYNQKAEDHQSILIVIKHLSAESQLATKSFNKIYDRITRINEVKIQDAQGMGCERIVRLRFKKNDLEEENNEWGDFQAHRKVLGLITVSKTTSDLDLDNIYTRHEELSEKYSASLLDSRCFIYKAPPDKTVSDLERDSNATTVPSDLSNDLTNQTNIEPLKTDVIDIASSNASNNISTGTVEVDLSTKSADISVNLVDSAKHSGDTNGKDSTSTSTLSQANNQAKQRNVQAVIYSTTSSSNGNEVNDSSLHLFEHAMTQDIKNLVASLFWVLESKRLDRSYEKVDRLHLLVAPFEGKTVVGLDKDSKAYKKRCLGRMKKHIGDLSLLAGLPSEALTHYTNSISLLKAVNDWLWLASAIEGQCVASLSLIYPVIGTRKMSLQRNASLPPSKFKQLQENVAKSALTNGTEQQPETTRKPRLSSLSFNSNKLTTGDNGLPNGLDPMIIKALGKNLLATPNDIYDKYKEACCHYAKVIAPLTQCTQSFSN